VIWIFALDSSSKKQKKAGHNELERRPTSNLPCLMPIDDDDDDNELKGFIVESI
jgi:hypothetical protein